MAKKSSRGDNSAENKKLREKCAELEKKLQEKEKELKQTKGFYEGLLDSIPLPIYAKDKNRRYTFVNKVLAEKILQDKKENIIGYTLSRFKDVIPPSNIKSNREEDTRVIEKKKSRVFETNVKIKNGPAVTARIHMNPLRNNHSRRIEGLAGLIVDITEEVAIKEKLEEKNNEFENLFDAIQDGISVLDKDLRIVKANKTLLRLYENRKPVERKKCYEVYHDRKKPCEVCPSIRALKTGKMESDIIPKDVDGTQVGWLELYAYPVKSEDGKVERIVEFVRDITEAREAEERLRENERMLSEMSRLAKVGAWEYDVAKDKLTWSEGIYNIYEMEPGKPIDVDFAMSKYSDESRIVLIDAFNKAVTKGIPYMLELTLIALNGEEKLVRASCKIEKDKGRMKKVTGAFQDITDIKKAELELIENQKKFKLLAENSTDIITLIEDGRVTYISPAVKKIAKADKHQYENFDEKMFGERIHPEDKAEYFERLYNDRKKRTSRSTYVYRFKRFDGEYIWLEDRAERRFNKKTDKYSAVIVTRNINDLKNALDSVSENEILLNRIGDVAKVGGWEYDLITGKLHWTAQTRKIHELPDDYEPDIENALDFFTGESKERLSDAFDKLLNKGRSYFLELDFITAKSNKLRVKASGRSIKEKGKIIKLIGAFQDITDIRSTETALAESQKKYQILFDSAHDAIAIMRGENIIDCNASAMKMFRATREQLIRYEPGAISPEFQPDGRSSSELIRKYIAAANKGEPQQFEWVSKRVDGTTFDALITLKRIDVDNEILLLAVLRDESERKDALKALEESEAKFRLITENSSDIVTLIEDNEIVYHSPAYKKIMHASDHEWKQLTLAGIIERVHPDDRDEALGRAAQDAEKGLDKTLHQYRYKNHKGEYIWIEDNISRIFDENGTLVKTVVSSRDVTKTKQLEQELKESEQKYRLLGDNAFDLITLHNQTGGFEYISPSVKKNDRVYS